MDWKQIPLNEGERVPLDYRRRYVWESDNLKQVVVVDGSVRRDGFSVGLEEKNEVPFTGTTEWSRSMDWLGMVVTTIREEISEAND